MEVDRHDSLSDHYTTMTADEIKKQVWITQTDATYEDLYKTKKVGVHSLTRAAPELDESNREWQIEIQGQYHTVPAFQSCMYEKGTHVVGRHHALPGSSHKNFRGFAAIVQDLLRWINPDDSEENHACFLEAMRQASMTYLFYATTKHTEHMVRTSNIIQHPFAIAQSAYSPGAPTQNGKTIALIWQTRWMREAISITSRIAYAETGVPPTLDNLTGASSKVTFTMANYVRESNAHTQNLTKGKRSIVLDAGSLHRVDLSQGLSPDDKSKQKKGGDEKDSPNAAYTKYGDLTTTPSVRLLHARDSKLATLVSTQPHSMIVPLNHLNVVSRKLFEKTPIERPTTRDESARERERRTSLERALFGLSTSIKPLYHPNVGREKMFDKLTVQVREAAERETEMLRISNLLAESIQNLEDTKRLVNSATDSRDETQKELDTLKIQYEEIIQLKATTDYEKTAAISERDASMREKKAADEQVGRGLKALAALEHKMAAETKIFETKLDEMMKKEWKAPAEVNRMNAKVSAHEKTITSLKAQLELRVQKDENNTEEGKEEVQQMRDDLAELKKDYRVIESSADEALNEFSSEMDNMNQQVRDLQAVIKTQDDEIKELHTLKPRGLSKVMDAAAQSAPAKTAAPVATTQTAAKAGATAAPAALPAVQAAPADQTEPHTAGSSSASIPSDYVYQAKCPEDPSQSEYKELTITEVAGQLMASKQEMHDNIINQKERLKLEGKKMSDEQKINASRLYDEEMGHNVELWHACMSDHGQKYIAFGHKRAKGFQTGKPKMNCCGCGKVQGGWDMLHTRADRHTHSRTCPAKGTVCPTCDKYHLTDQPGSERYTMHTDEACPLNNSVAFCKKIGADLVEKHSSAQDLGVSNTSAWS